MCYHLRICLELADGLKLNIIPGPEWKFQENELCLPIKIWNPELLSLAMNLKQKQTVFLWCSLSHLKDPVCASIILHKEEAGRQLSRFPFLLASQWVPLSFFLCFLYLSGSLGKPCASWTTQAGVLSPSTLFIVAPSSNMLPVFLPKSTWQKPSKENNKKAEQKVFSLNAGFISAN